MLLLISLLVTVVVSLSTIIVVKCCYKPVRYDHGPFLKSSVGTPTGQVTPLGNNEIATEGVHAIQKKINCNGKEFYIKISPTEECTQDELIQNANDICDKYYKLEALHKDEPAFKEAQASATQKIVQKHFHEQEEQLNKARLEIAKLTQKLKDLEVKLGTQQPRPRAPPPPPPKPSGKRSPPPSPKTKPASKAPGGTVPTAAGPVPPQPASSSSSQNSSCSVSVRVPRVSGQCPVVSNVGGNFNIQLQGVYYPYDYAQARLIGLVVNDSLKGCIFDYRTEKEIYMRTHTQEQLEQEARDKKAQALAGIMNRNPVQYNCFATACSNGYCFLGAVQSLVPFSVIDYIWDHYDPFMVVQLCSSDVVVDYALDLLENLQINITESDNMYYDKTIYFRPPLFDNSGRCIRDGHFEYFCPRVLSGGRKRKAYNVKTHKKGLTSSDQVVERNRAIYKNEGAMRKYDPKEEKLQYHVVGNNLLITKEGVLEYIRPFTSPDRFVFQRRVAAKQAINYEVDGTDLVFQLRSGDKIRIPKKDLPERYRDDKGFVSITNPTMDDFGKGWLGKLVSYSDVDHGLVHTSVELSKMQSFVDLLAMSAIKFEKSVASGFNFHILGTDIYKFVSDHKYTFSKYLKDLIHELNIKLSEFGIVPFSKKECYDTFHNLTRNGKGENEYQIAAIKSFLSNVSLILKVNANVVSGRGISKTNRISKEYHPLKLTSVNVAKGKIDPKLEGVLPTGIKLKESVFSRLRTGKIRPKIISATATPISEAVKIQKMMLSGGREPEHHENNDEVKVTQINVCKKPKNLDKKKDPQKRLMKQIKKIEQRNGDNKLIIKVRNPYEKGPTNRNFTIARLKDDTGYSGLMCPEMAYHILNTMSIDVKADVTMETLYAKYNSINPFGLCDETKLMLREATVYYVWKYLLNKSTTHKLLDESWNMWQEINVVRKKDMDFFVKGVIGAIHSDCSTFARATRKCDQSELTELATTGKIPITLPLLECRKRAPSTLPVIV